MPLLFPGAAHFSPVSPLHLSMLLISLGNASFLLLYFALKMEAFPQVHFNLVMRCCNLWLLFILSVTCFSSYCGAWNHSFGFSCGGGPPFGYPFVWGNSGWGDPLLQLHCDNINSDRPLLDINGAQYYILEYSNFDDFNLSQGIEMTIIDKNLMGKMCDPSSSNSTMQFWSIDRLHIVDGYKNITLLEGCQHDTLHFPKTASRLGCNVSFYYNKFRDSNWTEKCKSQVQLPVRKDLDPGPNLAPIIKEGFNIKWTPSNDCKQCASNKGMMCAYNANIPSNPLICKPRQQGIHSDHLAEKSSNAVRLGVGIGVSLCTLMFIVLLLMVLYKRRSVLLFITVHKRRSPTSNTERFLEEYIHEMPTRYSYYQLQSITNNFADKLGEGGFGVVYKGKLPNGTFVAVKLLDSSRHSESQFMNEVATVGRIHHVNLVRLMGYCFDGSREVALVYEFMANGSLDKFIFPEKGKNHILSLEQSYSIAVGAARGIAYLHQDCKNRIIHFDIKPQNILLDEDFTPKIADFGLAKICGRGEEHISLTATRGTPGYVAPEVWSRSLGPATHKSDVYSFGMLLLEIVGARRNIDVGVSRSSQLYFPEWAFKLMQNGQLEMMLKAGGRGEIGCEEEEKAKRLTKVGVWCIQHNSRDRPWMSKVVQMLEGNGEDVSTPPMPFDSSITPTVLFGSSSSTPFLNPPTS